MSGKREAKKLKGLLTIADVLDLLPVSESGLYNMGKKGILRPRSICGRIYYVEQEVQDFITNPPIAKAFLTANEIKAKQIKSKN